MKFWGVCWLMSKMWPRKQLKDSVVAVSELNFFFFNLPVDCLVSATLLSVFCCPPCCTACLSHLLPVPLKNPRDLGESCWASCQLPTAAAWEALAADLCVAKQWRSDSAFRRCAWEQERRCSRPCGENAFVRLQRLEAVARRSWVRQRSLFFQCLWQVQCSLRE